MRSWLSVGLVVCLGFGAIGVTSGVSRVATESALPASGAASDGLIAFESVLACPDLGTCYSAVYVARSDGTGVRRVTLIDNLIDDPALSPDGSRIVYSRWPYGLWVVNADGRGKHQLCGDTCGDHPAWSPDGSRIAYLDGAAIGVMRADGSGHRLLLRFKGEPEDLDWSPDGKQLAFTGPTRPAVEPERGWEGVWLVNAAGSGLKRFARDVHYPRWSPDGKKLLVIGGHSGGFMRNIYVVDRRGGKPTLVVRRAPVYSVSWSPDGKRIAYSSGDSIHIFDLKTRRDTPLTLRPSPCAGLKNCDSQIDELDWEPTLK